MLKTNLWAPEIPWDPALVMTDLMDPKNVTHVMSSWMEPSFSNPDKWLPWTQDPGSVTSYIPYSFSHKHGSGVSIFGRDPFFAEPWLWLWEEG